MNDIDMQGNKVRNYAEMEGLSIKKKKKMKTSKILKKKKNDKKIIKGKNKENKTADKKTIKKKKGKKKNMDNKEINISEEENSTIDNPQYFSDTYSSNSNSNFIYEKKKNKKKITYDNEENKYSSTKFINFLKDYNENDGKNNKKNMNNVESRELGNDDDDDNNSVYNYLPQNNDIYKINGNVETLDITDLIGLDNNILENNIVKDIYSLKSDKKSKNRHISVLEEQRINSQMTYIKNVQDLNKINKSYNILQNSWRIMFGQNKDENITSEEYINKNLLKRHNNLSTKNIPDNDMNVIDNKNVAESVDEKNNVFDFEEEMKKNLEKSKMLIVSDDILKSEKEKKREQSKKIAQLKSLLAMERKKHALRKHIKSKSYRKYLRIKEKKEHEKMWDKLYSEHPELAMNISNYEDEYAKKRNVINNVKKKRKIFNLLNRYKNEELKKEMLKSFQMDKEEKNMLKKIVQKTAIQQDIGEGYSFDNINSKHQEIENTITSNDSEFDEKNEEDIIDIENERAKNVKKELKKRNLLRFSFMKNAEEKKKNDKIYKKRKQLLEKAENKRDENDSLLNSSDDENDQNNQSDQNEVSLVETTEISKLSSKEVEKAKLQLKEDMDLGNMLRKNAVLNTNNIINLDFELNETEIEEPDVKDVENNNTEEKKEEKTNNEKDKIKEKKINDLVDIDKINDEDILKQYGEKITVYNFENNIYENYININDTINNRENEELFELSDSEKITGEELNVNEWCNYNTLIEREQNIIKKEKEIIEKKKNMPLHTINVLNKKDKKFDVYYVDKIPYPYEKNEYEKSLNININKEVNDISAFNKLIAPQMTNKIGNIISPLVHNPFEIANILTLRKKKNKAKL
ncbi:U3 small nucleolar RNA-associated protein 14, putative [Plasmodium berghei]|uniref:U3 small nucleolar RNA-associated protein 14, putative n=1 Tax=Plasmodium berghei TaxID=5821 RepID=A0A113SB06_PLABE|nr:U3 small nucleolar RNA-associated protein 14, putative [Plasmodium berghei]